MKICLVICVLFATHCYGLPVEVAHEAVSCKSVEYDLGMVEFNHYVTNQMKAEVCASRIFNYNATGRISQKYLGSEYNYATHQNPCTVVCMYDPQHESLIDVNSAVDPHNTYSEERQETPFTLSEYKLLTSAQFHVAENTVCGPEHMCDVNGCCVKEEPKQPEPEPEVEEPQEPHEEPEVPVEHKEPEEPQEPHVEEPVEHKEPEVPEEHKEPEVPEEPKEPEVPHEQPENPEEHKEPEQPEEPHEEPEVPEEHKEPEVPEEPKEPEVPEEHKEPEPQEPEEPHKEPVEEPHKEPEQPNEPIPEPEKQYDCKEPGVFADDEDQSSFFYCYLKSAHVKCTDGTVFNKERNQCEVPAPEDPHYTDQITCQSEGYFRNPYDCNKFYRCYFNDAAERTEGHLRIAFFQCKEGMIFESTARTCVLPEMTQEVCNNKQLTHEPKEPEIVDPEYERYLGCNTDGYFRNPFECTMFYRCYHLDPSETQYHLALYKCADGNVFDEVSKNCVPPERTAECVNHELPQELHYRE